MFQENLFFRNTTASLTATETSAALDISRTPQGGLAAVIVLPKQSAGDQITAKVQHSTNSSSGWEDLTSLVISSVAAASTDSVKLVRRFATEYRYVRLELTVTGTTPDYGAVKAMLGDRDAWNTLYVGATSSPATV